MREGFKLFLIVITKSDFACIQKLNNLNLSIELSCEVAAEQI